MGDGRTGLSTEVLGSYWSRDSEMAIPDFS